MDTWQVARDASCPHPPPCCGGSLDRSLSPPDLPGGHSDVPRVAPGKLNLGSESMQAIVSRKLDCTPSAATALHKTSSLDPHVVLRAQVGASQSPPDHGTGRQRLSIR